MVDMAKYGTFIWLSILALAAGFLIYPATNTLFLETTASHPYIMGFVKFAILSMMGEFLAARLVYGKWTKVRGMIPKMVVWGIVGVMIVAMFSVFSHGVDGAAADGLLYLGGSKFLRAFLISAIMNLTFAPVFMASHRITDLYIDSRYAGKATSVSQIIGTTDWGKFIKDIVGKNNTTLLDTCAYNHLHASGRIQGVVCCVTLYCTGTDSVFCEDEEQR